MTTENTMQLIIRNPSQILKRLCETYDELKNYDPKEFLKYYNANKDDEEEIIVLSFIQREREKKLIDIYMAVDKLQDDKEFSLLTLTSSLRLYFVKRYIQPNLHFMSHEMVKIYAKRLYEEIQPYDIDQLQTKCSLPIEEADRVWTSLHSSK
jgi:hypothetical protein